MENKAISPPKSFIVKRPSKMKGKMLKEYETQQMKALREKVAERQMQKAASKSTIPCNNTKYDSGSVSLRSSSSLQQTGSNNKNDTNNKIILTSQMHAPTEKSPQNCSNTCNLRKRRKTDLEKKQPNSETMNQTLKTHSEKQRKNVQCQINVNEKNYFERNQRNGIKKNIAKERMRKLRRSLTLENSLNAAKSSQTLNRSLPISQCKTIFIFIFNKI